MANFTVGDDVTRPAGADLSAASNIFKIVKKSSGNVILATAGTDKLFGVISKVAPSSSTGSPVGVHVRNASGTYKVVAGGTISEGDAITATTGGVAITTTTSGDQILGYADQAAVTGDIFEYLPSTGKY